MAYTFRKGINFAKKIDKYYKKEKIFSFFRKFSIFLSLMTVILTIVLLTKSLRLSLLLKEKNLEKKRLMNEFLQTATENEMLFTISTKTRLIRKILRTDDVKFLNYYKAINDILEELSHESSASAVQIKQFSLKKDRTVNFELITQQPSAYLQLLDSFDTPKFLNLFESLTLKKFSIANVGKIEMYSLKFSGKFKPIYEESK